mgnify:CR=1 FL=1
MDIPTHHLSVRVPWHDNGWNGKLCCDPRGNGSCMFLPRINESKNVAEEDALANEWIHEVAGNKLPPCVGEKVTFMSPHDVCKQVDHPYADNENNSAFYGHYRPTTYCYPGYSFSVIPYNWMLKNAGDNTSAKATELELDYDVDREPALNFANAWVQQIDNQNTLLNTFIQPIVPGESLVFVYAKNIPFIDTTSRILIGVGHISKIGKLTEYDYSAKTPGQFRSTLWERPVHHTIRDDGSNGFLLPYHDLIKAVEQDDSINVADYIALAPVFEEFSYGSEWVSNDTAIESLLILHEKLKKMEGLLPGKSFEAQYQWIDNEISRIWKMRGPFPGLGAVLSGLNIPSGNLIAWQIEKIVRSEETGAVIQNPWDYINKLFNGDDSFLPARYRGLIDATLTATWNMLSADEKAFLELLSRMNVNNYQVKQVINLKPKEQKKYLENPYCLYEEFRNEILGFPVNLIDKAIFADNAILEKFPLPEAINIHTALDQRRIRAIAVDILEKAAINGNTLLTDQQLVTTFDELPVTPACHPSTRNLLAIQEFLTEEVVLRVLDKEEDLHYYKLSRLESVREKIRNFVQKRIKRPFQQPVATDWPALLNQEFGAVDTGKPQWFQQRDEEARREKELALQTLSNNRFSVLIGPAGTGKTRLLKIFCNLDFINRGSVLRLAPTGKARVKMGKDAMTLAQFLIKTKRYDPETGRYYLNPEGKQEKYETVIVDEASMLTEEQLAALLDSLTGVDRFILVGDYRQLPPIGSGRPFVDIYHYLQNEQKGVAELKVLFRQLVQDNVPDIEEPRLDVRLSRWFSDDEIKKQQEDIFTEIAFADAKDWPNISFVEWHNVKHLEQVITDVIDREVETQLQKNGQQTYNREANFAISLGGTYIADYNWSAFNIDAAGKIENWQMLSPTRSLGYGTKVMNQHIQKSYRGKTKEKAINPGKFQKRKMHKPVGDDGIVYGDKIINIKNKRLNKPGNKVYNPDGVAEESILKYMANGEIGIHTGKYGPWTYDSPRPLNIAFSSQEGFAYIFKEADFQEDGDIQMELAYSITVHKSQGSGFKTVLFILPNPCPILSRELFYTALTRQEDRIVILHQGPFSDFRKFAGGDYSETARRLTDLFSEPTLKLINKKYYDTRYIQVSEKGEFMISKSEVIIADKLYHCKVDYVYEAPLADDGGVVIHPDFTIEDPNTGITYYWEHLGLLPKDDYRSKWERKKEWYARNGIEEYTINPDADKQLIITRDKADGGIDSTMIRKIIDELFLQ